ncbi:MAG: NAD(P)H-hydrate dehydratase, partial [Calditrichaeota bacterium]|nr:NAD(P)H-hydrate dehydratase [Calditrichota bacterium]
QIHTKPPRELSLEGCDLIVDALLGTGTREAPSKLIAQAIEAINRAPGFVLSVDIPSGVNGSTGEVPGEAVRADATVTFGYAKRGLYLHPGRDYVGQLTIANISIPPFADLEDAAKLRMLEFADVAELLPARPRHAHKGDFGKVFVLAGSRGLSGAAAMVAESVLRVGAGMVTVGCPQSVLPMIAGRRAEVMTRALAETKDGCLSEKALQDALEASEWADVVVIGPGLGLADETTRLLEAYVPHLKKPIVIDADGLNHLARSKSLKKALPRKTIITPHAGEFGRITGQDINDILKNPVEEAAELAKRTDWVVVLKGAPTFAADASGFVFLNPTGNPGLATAGSGDVLTGVIAGLLAQRLSPIWAASVGIFLHGLAGDIMAAEIGEASLIAGDVIEALPSALATIEGGQE